MITPKFGWEVVALFNDKMVKFDDTSERKIFHYRTSSESAAIRRVKLKPFFFRIVETIPVTEEQWRRVYGNPEERGL